MSEIALIGSVAVLGGALTLVWRLFSWGIKASDARVTGLTELRTLDSRVRGLQVAVDAHKETIKTLKGQLARADAAVAASKEQFDEILQTLAHSGDPARASAVANAALERLSKLPTADAGTAADRSDGETAVHASTDKVSG